MRKYSIYFLSKSSSTMTFGGVFMTTYADTWRYCWYTNGLVMAMTNIFVQRRKQYIKESTWNLSGIKARTKYHNTKYHNCNFGIMSGNEKIHFNENIASCKTQRKEGSDFLLKQHKLFNFCIASFVWLWAIAKSASPPI